MYVSQIETILVDIQKRAVCVFAGTVRCIETLTKRARTGYPDHADINLYNTYINMQLCANLNH